MMSIWETIRVTRARAGMLLLLALASSSLTAAVDVVVTLRPLAFIIEPLLAEDDTISVLLDARDSPHDFSLTPSARLTLAEADLILWIGPEQEQALSDFLGRPSAAGQRALAATRLQGMTLHRLDADHIDPHVWLDPLNAVVLARSVAGRLTTLAPERSAEFARKAEAFAVAMRKLTDSLAPQLADLRPLPFLVFHNAFQYFERRFGLSHSLALVTNPEVQPGMQTILRRRQQIEASAARCLLREPGASLNLIRTLTAGVPTLRVTEVDLLGYRVSAAPDAYEQLLLGVVESFRSCLTGESA